MALLIFCEFFEKRGPSFGPKMYGYIEGHFLSIWKGGKSHQRQASVMTYPQYRKARKLVHECCNYDHGNCIALDGREECICVQSISYSLLCKWFRVAVLPLDKELETACLFRYEMKRCILAAQPFRPRLQTGPSIARPAQPKPTVNREPPANGEEGANRADAPDEGVERGQLETKKP